MLTRLAAVVAVLAIISPAIGADATLAPTGTLRAVYLAGNASQAVMNAQTGEVTGPAIDLARELARRAGVPLQIDGLQGVPAVIEAVRDGRADIGFIANDPSRRGPIEFSQTYLRNPQSIAVPEGSPIASFADLSKPGLRVGGLRNDSVTLYIGRTYPNVRLVEMQGDVSEIRALLHSGQVDGFASNRIRLGQVVEGAPGLRVLPGSILGVPQAIIVPANQPARLKAVNDFIDAVRASGFLQASITRAANGTEIEPALRD